MILRKLNSLNLLNSLKSFYNHKIYSIAMVAFAIVVFIIFLLPFFIDLNRYKPEIENKIEKFSDGIDPDSSTVGDGVTREIDRKPSTTKKGQT